MNVRFLLAAFLSYVIGSVPFGLLLARGLKGIDIRRHGSGNIGATNVFRVVGKKWGIFVLVLDTLKGVFAIFFPAFFFCPNPSVQQELILGIVAILGHTFPVWLSFRGGKGVATSLGVFLYILPVPTLITFAFWAAVFALCRIISAASLAAALVFPEVIFWTSRNHSGFPWLLGMGVFLTCFIFYTHRANIKRLLSGEEKKLF